MGLFHCPLGAPYYESEGCVRCGLCRATNAQEAVEASRKIRAALQKQARQRRDKYAIRKIAVCGKGGTGKTTVTYLLALALEDLGYRVLVLDADESNPGLARLFGFDRLPEPLSPFLRQILCDPENPQQSQRNSEPRFSLRDIPSTFFVQRGEIRFLFAGKIEDPFQGCACPISHDAAEFVLRLSLAEGEILVVDHEAGIESFGRGAERGVDTLLIVIEPSCESLAVAERIRYMAEGIGIARIRAILNKIPAARIEETLLASLREKGIRYLGSLCLDAEISEAALTGGPFAPSKAHEQMRSLVRLMLDEAEMPSSREATEKMALASV